jgi:hypothetical protein
MPCQLSATQGISPNDNLADISNLSKYDERIVSQYASWFASYHAFEREFRKIQTLSPPPTHTRLEETAKTYNAITAIFCKLRQTIERDKLLWRCKHYNSETRDIITRLPEFEEQTIKIGLELGSFAEKSGVVVERDTRGSIYRSYDRVRNLFFREA